MESNKLLKKRHSCWNDQKNGRGPVKPKQIINRQKRQCVTVPCAAGVCCNLSRTGYTGRARKTLLRQGGQGSERADHGAWYRHGRLGRCCWLSGNGHGWGIAGNAPVYADQPAVILTLGIGIGMNVALAAADRSEVADLVHGLSDQPLFDRNQGAGGDRCLEFLNFQAGRDG